jgi:hypothetical protein
MPEIGDASLTVFNPVRRGYRLAALGAGILMRSAKQCRLLGSHSERRSDSVEQSTPRAEGFAIAIISANPPVISQVSGARRRRSTCAGKVVVPANVPNRSSSRAHSRHAEWDRPDKSKLGLTVLESG